MKILKPQDDKILHIPSSKSTVYTASRVKVFKHLFSGGSSNRNISELRKALRERNNALNLAKKDCSSTRADLIIRRTTPGTLASLAALLRNTPSSDPARASAQGTPVPTILFPHLDTPDRYGHLRLSHNTWKTEQEDDAA